MILRRARVADPWKDSGFFNTSPRIVNGIAARQRIDILTLCASLSCIPHYSDRSVLTNPISTTKSFSAF